MLISISNSFWRCTWISPFSWLCKPTAALQNNRWQFQQQHLLFSLPAALPAGEKEPSSPEGTFGETQTFGAGLCSTNSSKGQCDMATTCYGMSRSQRTALIDLYTGNLRAAAATRQCKRWSYKHKFAVKYIQSCKDGSEHQGLKVFSISSFACILLYVFSHGA